VAPRWRVPLAWAATIVVALGVGIYGGQAVLRRAPTEADLPAAQDRVVESPRAAPITALAAADSTPARDAAKSTQAPVDLVAVPMPGATAAAPRDTTAAANRVTPAGLAAATLLVDTTPRRVDSSAALALAARQEQAAKAEPAAAAPAPAPQTPMLRDSGRTVERRAFTPTMAPAGADARGRAAESFGFAASPISADSARALLGTAPVTVPDLPVTAMRTLNDAVIVDQVVPPGRVISLFQRRAAADEEQTRAADPLARYVGGLRVEIRGALPADSLRMLLERVR
jgi:hypothetical protein